MEVGSRREMNGALRVVRALVPDREVLQRTVPLPVQLVRPSDARSSKLIRSFVEAPPDGLPGQEPTVLLRVGEGLLHL